MIFECDLEGMFLRGALVSLTCESEAGLVFVALGVTNLFSFYENAVHESNIDLQISGLEVRLISGSCSDLDRLASSTLFWDF
jgi:hypothetical protein